MIDECTLTSSGGKRITLVKVLKDEIPFDFFSRGFVAYRSSAPPSTYEAWRSQAGGTSFEKIAASIYLWVLKEALQSLPAEWGEETP